MIGWWTYRRVGNNNWLDQETKQYNIQAIRRDKYKILTTKIIKNLTHSIEISQIVLPT
jgi:hypothetical protein